MPHKFQMHYFVTFLIVFVSLVDYLTEPNRATGSGGWLPGGISYIAELCGLLALVYVAAVGSQQRFRQVRGIYWIFFGALGIVAVCSSIANSVEPGPAFAGTRNYLRALPFFFLPAVVVFTDRQIRAQLRVLMVLCFIQLPLAIQQRIATRAIGEWTGDFTSGTLGISSILSIYLICGICISAGLHLKGWLRPRQLAVLFILLIAPTAINETKGTFFLLPIGLLVTFLVGSAPHARLLGLIKMSGLLTLFGVIFVVGYDYWAQDVPYPVFMLEYLTDADKLGDYMYSRDEIGATEKAGRIDAILVPLSQLAKDPVTLAFGLGVGNVSDSALGPNFTGAYYSLFFPFLKSAASRIVLELGLFGLALLLLLLLTIFRDSCVVAKSDNSLVGGLAAGWAGAVAVISISVFYKDIVGYASLSYLFWYWSGLIAAHRMRLRKLPD